MDRYSMLTHEKIQEDVRMATVQDYPWTQVWRQSL